ncbi:MAG: hypothetical protein Q9220_002057 [cf. Caloplaca sp. 1 TL-2023]
MYSSTFITTLIALPAFSFALPQGSEGGGLQGYATFNQYSAQKTGIDCTADLWSQSGKKELVDNQKIFGAAAGDISTGLAKGHINATTLLQIYKNCLAIGELSSNLLGLLDALPHRVHLHIANCILPTCSTTPQPGVSYKLPKADGSDYKPPFCPGARCGKCYTVTNPSNQKKITIQIIDACPAYTAFNYCKALAKDPKDIVQPKDRCGDANTNSLDIDTSAYAKLSDSGQGYESGMTPNLNVMISDNPGCTS